MSSACIPDAKTLERIEKSEQATQRDLSRVTGLAKNRGTARSGRDPAFRYAGILSRPLMTLRVGVSGISGVITRRSGSLVLAILCCNRNSTTS